MDGAGGRGCPEGHQCHGGTCPNTWGHQCQRLWGDGAGAAPASCFHGNQRGDVYGNCGRRGTTFIPCSREDSLCGKLPCVGGTRFPVSGSTLSVGSCRFAGISDSARSNSEDVSLVSDGTPCGQDKVCVGQRCVLVTSLGAEICSTTRCGGHGVCNNLGQCHCDLGWSPPHCDVKVAEPAGTVVTTVVVVVVVVVVIVLCLPLIFLALRRYRNSAARQNTYSQHLEEMQSIPDIQAKRPPPPPPAQTRDHLVSPIETHRDP
ncbi:disintegrin and metalloproteinase domain-containing protein 28-like isoform X4 [Petromyzon marinus]|uniref:disintegrin and metalloproteinase domain-containing protein 28-like isoform X4 n=1 Tax=Petromyzon marinus TaxID=7757 RepID=UPI003F7208E4